MSRIGKLPISIPAGVTVSQKDNVVTVKGPKGELSQFVDPSIVMTVEDGNITFTLNEENTEVDLKQQHAFHGLYRSLVNNMVVGVSEGFSKELEINGIGYRAAKQGKDLVLNIGYSHQVIMPEIDGITIEVPNNNSIIISGADKQKVGQMAAVIRGKRPPEPYHGKGVKYSTEYVRRKAGKAGKGK